MISSLLHINDALQFVYKKTIGSIKLLKTFKYLKKMLVITNY